MSRLICVLVISMVAVAGLTATAVAASPQGKYIVVLKDSVGDLESVSAEHERKFGLQREGVYGHALKGYAATMSATTAKVLESDERVLFVARDREFKLAAASRPQPRCEDVPSSIQCLPDGLNRIDGELSSARAGDGAGTVGVNVAVIDSGIDLDHPDLNVAGGVDCRGKGPVPGGDDIFGHGTFVAGVIGAKDDGIGVVGVAPGARLWAVRVVGDKEKISESSLICAVDWVAATRSDGIAGNDISVANMSITGGGQDDGNCGRTNKDPLHVAFCAAVASGVTVTIAAGNAAGDLANELPSAYDEVLAVTAMGDFDGAPGALDAPVCYGVDFGAQYGDFDDAIASFSNFATLASDRAHTIAAPGVCIDSTAPGGYAHSDGTSFSSPHVAGVAALCIASGPCAGLTSAQVRQKLLNDARAYNENKKNKGYGFLGDPLRPVAGKYYGYLVNASLY